MSEIRTRFTAEYMYPGALFPESVTRTIAEPTMDEVVAEGPDEDGYFRKDGWYAVAVRSITEKRFVSGDGEVEWVRQGEPVKVFSAVVGERIHADEIEDTDRNAILISNIRCNSRGEPFGVRTRAGNWQIASDYDYVLEPADLS